MASVKASWAIASSVLFTLINKKTKMKNLAAVGIEKGELTYGTSSTIEARDDSTVVFEQLAIGARMLSWTGASVRSLSSVKAGATVLARLVVGAVVEILVAKEAAPSFIAIALVGLLAGAVKAARVADALVAQLSLPAKFAEAFVGLVAEAVLIVAARKADG